MDTAGVEEERSWRGWGRTRLQSDRRLQPSYRLDCSRSGLGGILGYTQYRVLDSTRDGGPA